MAEQNGETVATAQVFEDFKKKIVEAKFCPNLGKNELDLAMSHHFTLNLNFRQNSFGALFKSQR